MSKQNLSRKERILKRSFDIIFALTGIVLLWWVILISFVVATIDTREWGFFTQVRVGKHGKLFKIVKIRTMRKVPGINSTVTRKGDPRITKTGALLRKLKIDELPQLFNVLLGHMSFVGPRPDVPGYADRLEGEDRMILNVRPGITGPATLHFRNEEALLAQQEDPDRYNDEVIYPAKVALNKAYIQNFSMKEDIKFILRTVFGDRRQSSVTPPINNVDEKSV